MGNSDKQIFYAKEMTADLNFKSKSHLCPFLVTKLDMNSINYFEYPKVPADMSKYTLRHKGIQGLEYLLETERFAIAGVAKSKVDE